MRVFIQLEDPELAGRLPAVLVQDGVASAVLDQAEPDVDVVIVDLGAAPAKALPAVPSGGHLLVVIAHSASEKERVALFDHGADHILHGEVSVAEVAAQVRAIARRLVRPRPPLPVVVLDHDSCRAIVYGRRIPLTGVEFKLLSVLMAVPGRTFSTDDLMAAVWGSAAARSTVSAHIRRLRRKIEPDPSSPKLIRTAWGAGYALHLDVTQTEGAGT